jgi:hypothetical protein
MIEFGDAVIENTRNVELPVGSVNSHCQGTVDQGVLHVGTASDLDGGGESELASAHAAVVGYGLVWVLLLRGLSEILDVF